MRNPEESTTLARPSGNAGTASSRQTPRPTTGRALFAWTMEQEQRYEVGLLRYLNRWARLQGFSGRMVDWDAVQVQQAHAEASLKLQAIALRYHQAYAG